MAANVKHLAADGATQLTQFTWPDAVAGNNQSPGKFGFQSVSDRALANVQLGIAAVGLSDGSTELRIALDTATLSAPWGLTATLNPPGSGGTWTIIGNKGFVVTAVNALGETIASAEVVVNITDITQTVTLQWQPVTNATGYRVFDTDTPGSYVTPSLRLQLPVLTTYVDKGGARQAGVPPSDNRTAGWFAPAVLGATNSGGVWATTGPRFWRVAAFDATNSGAILAASLETSLVIDATNKRAALSWLPVPGAAIYGVYRSQLSGSYINPALVGTTSNTSFNDIGSVAGLGQLTASPSYGIPPASGSFGTAALLTGTSMPIGQQVFYWVNRVVPVSTPEAGNPRVASITIKET